MTTALSLQMLEAAVEQCYDAILVTGAELDAPGPRIVYANPAFCRMSGYAHEELLGRSPRLLQGPETDTATIERLRQCLREGRRFEGTTVNYRKDGSRYCVEWHISPVRDAQGRISHFLSVQREITARLQAEQQRELLASALNATADSVLITDRAGTIVFANRAFEAQTGYPVAEVLGKTPRLLQSGQHGADFYQQLWRNLERGESFRSTFTNRRRDGSLFHLEQTITPARDADGRISHFVSVSKDLTERVEKEQALQVLAFTDKLTGLYNRSFGEQQLTHEWNHARRYRRPLSAIMADLDHFKAVNDTYGHACGDRILALLGDTLRRCVRKSDTVIRWGGEEFLILAPESDAETAAQLAERIRCAVAALRDPQVQRLTISLGVAQLSGGEETAQLIERADRALYAAKAAGRNRVEIADGVPA